MGGKGSGGKYKPMELHRATDRIPGKVAANGRHYKQEIVPVRSDDYALPVAPDELSERAQTEWEKVWSAGTWLKPERDYHHVLMIAHQLRNHRGVQRGHRAPRAHNHRQAGSRAC